MNEIEKKTEEWANEIENIEKIIRFCCDRLCLDNSTDVNEIAIILRMTGKSLKIIKEQLDS